MNDKIIKAIKQQLLLAFTYDSYFRIVEAHCFGISKKGSHCIRAYQLDGDSSDGKMGWKIFDLSKIRNLEIMDNCFLESRSGYRKGDTHMKEIIIEL